MTVTVGARTKELESIVVRRSLGLGGAAWDAQKPLGVADYRSADTISHDFDAQILGEDIARLTVAPIIVDRRLRGLLYAGERDPARSLHSEPLIAIAKDIAEELRIRDIVDERLKVRHNATARREPPEELWQSLSRIADTTSDEGAARELRTLFHAHLHSGENGLLTSRQRDVLDLVALGLTNDDIGARLGLSPLTVKSYLRTVMANLGVGNRLQAVLEARRRGAL
ncbi:LuxR C-terminal-related transcriptional regulator [Herbiconiux sp. CPCC 203407]|uniref:LuxR C-terminal-related transcriptional regulator n=1 Tax=Herbiconiux oxytropis TaxID=2970915 RepID=A0AA41XEW4_9MICO|nr:LuxR C-terminal-related transcriptional regulator [Herbiconiux oxytropis]MCS5726942.1 LuxR C-terminal-related transcriptional regulator [Herbiconiux oxytropis]